MAEDDRYWMQLARAEQLLNEARCRADKQAEGDAGIFLGNSYALVGQMTEATNTLEQAIPIYREFHSQAEISYVLLQFGSFLYQIECFCQALTVLEETLAIVKRIEIGQLLLECLCWLGVTSTEAGHFQKAISYHQEALAIIRINSDREAEMHTLGNLGGAYAKLGRSHEALTCHELALLIACEVGDVERQAVELGNLGYTYAETLGRSDVGIYYFEQALGLFHSYNDQYNEAKTLANIGGAHWKAQRFQVALRFLNQARGIAIEQEARGLIGSILSRIGNIYSALGQHDEAFQAYQRALLLDQGRGDREAEEQHLKSLGLLQQAKGNLEEALQLHRKALVLARERKDVVAEAQHFGNIAGALTLSGKVEEGFLHNKHAMAMFQALGDILGEGRVYVNMGTAYVNTKIIYTNTGFVYVVQGNKGKALAYWRMGQNLLRTANRAEEEEVRHKIDIIKDIIHERTFHRWWRMSESHIRWLTFQRCWIDKEILAVGNKNDDLLFYSRDLDGDNFFTLNKKHGEQIWIQGDIAVQEENWRDALIYYRAALTVECEKGKPDTQALLLGNIGCSYAKVKKFDEGIAYLQQSLDLFRFLDDTSNEIKTLLNLGTLLLQAELIAEARAHFDKALNLTDIYESCLLDSIALRKMSEVYRICNKMGNAKSFLNYAFEAINIHGDKQEEGKLLTSSGLICVELGHTHKAILYLQRARDLYSTIHDKKSEGEQWCLLAIVYAMQGKFDRARDNFLQAQKIFHHYGDQLNESQIHVYIGVIYSFKDNLPCFIAYLRRALDLVERDVHAQERIKHMLDYIERVSGHVIYALDWQKSNRYYQVLR